MADLALTQADLADDPSVVPVGYSTLLPEGRIRCDLCPRACTLREAARVRRGLADRVPEVQIALLEQAEA